MLIGVGNLTEMVDATKRIIVSWGHTCRDVHNGKPGVFQARDEHAVRMCCCDGDAGALLRLSGGHMCQERAGVPCSSVRPQHRAAFPACWSLLATSLHG